MDHTQTLFFVPSPRSAHFAADVASSIRFSCQANHEVVTAAPYPSPPTYGRPWHRSKLQQVRPGFWCLDALHAAMVREFSFHVAVFVDDQCLVTKRGIDDWISKQLQAGKAGLLGVRDRDNFERLRVPILSFFTHRKISVVECETLPPAAASAIVALPYQTVKALFDAELLVPRAAAEWPASFGAYLSMAVTLLRRPVMLWGSMDRPKSPLYVNQTGAWRLCPPPDILDPGFLFYSSLAHVQGQSEEEVREFWRNRRDEAAGDRRWNVTVVDPREDD